MVSTTRCSSGNSVVRCIQAKPSQAKPTYRFECLCGFFLLDVSKYISTMSCPKLHTYRCVLQMCSNNEYIGGVVPIAYLQMCDTNVF